jgi:actin
MCKIGFAGDEAPRSVFPSAISRLKESSVAGGGPITGYRVGENALHALSISIVKYPIEHGIVTNWDDMEKIWNYAFSELLVDRSEHSILLTEAILNPRSNREKMLQIQFETFNVPSLYVISTAQSSFHSTCRMTGVVLEVGDGVTEVVPFYEGYAFPHAMIRQNFGGRDLTVWLQRMLMVDRNIMFTTSAEREMLRDMKKKLSYVALDFEAELHKAATMTDCTAMYTLPDGNELPIRSERFRCAELLFRPGFNGLSFDRIDQSLYNSIRQCDDETWNDLYQNIIVSGGTTLLKGFPERIEKEITRLAPANMKIQVIARPERIYAAWIGGSIFASSPNFPQMLITREEYNHEGAQIGHRKCF